MNRPPPSLPAANASTSCNIDDGDATAELLRRLRDGDASAPAELVTAFHPRLYRFIFRLHPSAADAEELTQDALVNALRAIGEFRGESGLKAWMYRIATNVVISHQRKLKHRKAASLDVAYDGADADASPLRDRVADSSTSPDGPLASHETAAAVQRALAAMSVDDRTIVLLCDVEGLSYQAIAEVMALNLGTVKSRIHRARQQLREQFEKQGVNPTA